LNYVYSSNGVITDTLDNDLYEVHVFFYVKADGRIQHIPHDYWSDLGMVLANPRNCALHVIDFVNGPNIESLFGASKLANLEDSSSFGKQYDGSLFAKLVPTLTNHCWRIRIVRIDRKSSTIFVQIRDDKRERMMATVECLYNDLFDQKRAIEVLF